MFFTIATSVRVTYLPGELRGVKDARCGGVERAPRDEGLYPHPQVRLLSGGVGRHLHSKEVRRVWIPDAPELLDFTSDQRLRQNTL